MWHSKLTINRTYSTMGGQNAWADIDTLGWRKIRVGSAVGGTNTLTLPSAAKANGRPVDPDIASTIEITRAVLK